MSVRSSQAITVEFVTSRFDTGAATNADSTPTGTLVVNGTDNGASVTVTNVDTGRYKAAVTLPTLSVGDVVELSVAATVNSVAGKGIVWRDTKDVIIDSAGLVDANTVKIGPSGSGVATTAALCTNLKLSFDTDFATLYDTTNKAFLSKLGNFAMGGSSLVLTTGAISGTTLTLSGAVALQSTLTVSGATSLAALSTSGTTTLNALTVTNATTLSGAVSMGSTLAITGNVSLAAGLTITQSSSNAAGLSITGNGTGAGILTTGGTTGQGIKLVGGSSSGDALLTATTSGHAFNLVATGTNKDALRLVPGSGGNSFNATGYVLFANWAINSVDFPTIDPAFGLPVNTVYINGTAGQPAIRAAVGLATGNLDTQLAAIAGYIDTEVATINTNLSALITTVGVAGAGLTAADDAVIAALSTLTTHGDSAWATATSVAVSDKTGFSLTSAYDFAKGTVQMTESYAADGSAPTPAQALLLIQQSLTEGAISGTTWTIKKVDGSATAAVVTLDSATTPTSKTRSA